MALDKAIASLPFVQGTDSRTDPKLSAKPARLVNAIFKRKTIQKRQGRSSMSQSIFGSTTLSNGQLLAPYDDSLLFLNNGFGYSYANETSNWVNLSGGSTTVGVTETDVLETTSLARPSGNVYGGDWAQVNGILVVAYATHDGLTARWFVDVYDAATMTLYNSTVTDVSGGEITVRCVALRERVLVIIKSTVSIFRAVVNTTTPAVAPTFAAVGVAAWSPASPGAGFDAFAYNSELCVVAYPINGTDLRLMGLDRTGTVTATPAATTIAGVTGANGLSMGLVATRDLAGNVFVFIGDANAGSTTFLVRSSTFALVLGVTNIVTTGNWSGLAASFRRAVTWQVSNGNIGVLFSSELAAAWLGLCFVNSAGIAQAFGELNSTQRLNLMSGTVNRGDEVLAACVNRSDDTPMIHIIDCNSGTIRATGLAWDGSTAPTTLGGRYDRLCKNALSREGGTELSFLVFQMGRSEFASFGGAVTDITPSGLAELKMTKTPATQLTSKRLGQSLYFPGALPRIFEGKSLVPLNFSLYPLPSSVAAGGAGNVDAGVHLYKFCWAWVTHKGELVRSPASTASTVTTVGGTGVTIDMYTIPLSVRDLMLDGLAVYLETYRTVAGQSVFYKSQISAVAPQVLYYNQVAYSTTTAGFLRVIDEVTDATLVTGELLYAQDGVLDWEAPPAHSASFVHQRRLVVCGLENRYAWLASSEYVDGEAVRFNQLLASSVPADTGPIIGGASMDGKLILFTTKAGYVTLGDGPDLLGNNPYPPVERIQSVDWGPISAAAIVETPMGVMYQTKKGIMLLDRGLNTVFIGEDVTAWSTEDWVVKSAVLDAKNYQVRFLADPGADIVGTQMGTMVPSNGGVSLVFDYEEKQWSVFEDYGGQGSTFFKDQYAMVRSDGLVRLEEDSTWRDNGTYYSLLTETPWIKLNTLQGFQRIWYMSLLGTWGSDCTVRLEVAYDYDGTSPDVPDWQTIETLDGGGLYSVGGPFKFRHHVGKKLEAVKFRISDEDVRGTGLGLLLTELAFEYGMKKGLFRLPATKTR